MRTPAGPRGRALRRARRSPPDKSRGRRAAKSLHLAGSRVPPAPPKGTVPAELQIPGSRQGSTGTALSQALLQPLCLWTWTCQHWGRQRLVTVPSSFRHSSFTASPPQHICGDAPWPPWVEALYLGKRPSWAQPAGPPTGQRGSHACTLPTPSSRDPRHPSPFAPKCLSRFLRAAAHQSGSAAPSCRQ